MAEDRYKLTFEVRPSYLYARVEADRATVETAIVYLREIADKCREVGARRLMIDRAVATMLPPADLFIATSDVVSRIPTVKTVLVDRDSDHTDDWTFAELVSTNRGANFTVKRNLAEAEAWLLE